MQLALSLLATLFSFSPAPVQDGETRQVLDEWREHLLPGSAERGFESIEWRDDFASGVIASAEAQRPLLFWAMNGHPLGCT